MLDLVHLSWEADELAVKARNARCCDALLPCSRCTGLRMAVRARRLVLKVPRCRLRLLRGFTSPKVRMPEAIAV